MPVVKSKFLNDIIKGWNEKLKFNNVDLTNLVPFVQIYALYDKEKTGVPFANDEARIRSNKSMVEHLQNRRADDVVNITIVDKERSVTKKYYFVGVEIAKLESQFASTNQKGGVGIESLKVNRGTRESFLSKYDMELVVTDVDIFKNNIEYTSMYSLNQHFLIMHGWSSTKMGSFLKPPVAENQELEVVLNDNHKGYWMTSIVSLQKFRFSLDQQSHLRCNLTFLSSILSKLIFKRTREFSSNILRELQTPTFVENELTGNRPSTLTNCNRIKNAILREQGGSGNLQGAPRQDRVKVYIFETKAPIASLNTQLNNLRQLIDFEIKERVKYNPEFGDVVQSQGDMYKTHAAAVAHDKKMFEWDKITNADEFIAAKSEIVNDISIEPRQIEWYFPASRSELDQPFDADRRGNRLQRRQESLEGRQHLFDSWYQGLQNNQPPIIKMATLADLRRILSLDIKLNQHIIYGTHLYASINSSADFKLYNPKYDPASDRSQFDDADDFIELPIGATINTNVTTKRIIELNPPRPPVYSGLFGPQHVDTVNIEGGVPTKRARVLGQTTEGDAHSTGARTVHFRYAIADNGAWEFHVRTNARGALVEPGPATGHDFGAGPSTTHGSDAYEFCDQYGNPTALIDIWGSIAGIPDSIPETAQEFFDMVIGEGWEG